ncbi:hypothetical protein MtrunA17_Chr2g0311421 [Medicago truncatula]|uniref:Uncharacterized protein n=1 Tax=Medicago truncatula TaxID=3880 RepID=A0A396JD38_MEDTR|nr:hypothetical protein MtrunA17_Chr2g0311421 [Medicago truncatula]
MMYIIYMGLHNLLDYDYPCNKMHRQQSTIDNIKMKEEHKMEDKEYK